MRTIRTAAVIPVALLSFLASCGTEAEGRPSNGAAAVETARQGIALAQAGRVFEARRRLATAALLDRGGRVSPVALAWLAHLPEYNAAVERLITGVAMRANPGLARAQALWLARAVAIAAVSHHLDPLFLAAVVHAESRWNHTAVSEAGAVGLGQLMPHVARGIGLDPYHPMHNLWGAARLLRGHLNAFAAYPDPLASALSAYNAGPTATRNARGNPPYPETAAYVRTVKRLYLLFLLDITGLRAQVQARRLPTGQPAGTRPLP